MEVEWSGLEHSVKVLAEKLGRDFYIYKRHFLVEFYARDIAGGKLLATSDTILALSYYFLPCSVNEFRSIHVTYVGIFLKKCVSSKPPFQCSNNVNVLP